MKVVSIYVINHCAQGNCDRCGNHTWVAKRTAGGPTTCATCRAVLRAAA